MRDILDRLKVWLDKGETIAIATVVNTWGSSPRPVGSKMAMTQRGGISGSVSAGCVESAVFEEGVSVLETGQPRLLTFGVADDEAWEVGLSCGGTIQVFVEPFSALDNIFELLIQNLNKQKPLAIVNLLEGSPDQINHKWLVLSETTVVGDLSLPQQKKRIVSFALEMMEKGISEILELEDGARLFIEVISPVPRLIIVGAVHVAEKLVPIANTSGFETIIIDPRQAYNNRDRFPSATELVREWPGKALAHMDLNQSTYMAILTHDPKLDDPALMSALPSRVGYVGAIGSRRTNQNRIARLREAGLDEDILARLHAPIGLDIGARLPEEIALSIMAEIIQVKNRHPADKSVA